MDILFARQRPTSIGRNGSFHTVGVQVEALTENQQPHCLQLAGITGRGNVASGHLAVPVEDVAQLIATLEQALREYYQGQGTPEGSRPHLALPNRPDARIIVGLPDGREVHLHRGNDNLGTIVDVWAEPTRGGVDETLTFWDASPEEEPQA